jgi:glycosyltransferase involved in cell wall biosynthesis
LIIMRIAQISTLATTLRPRGGGSVESLVGLLAREFSRLGHEVTVYAAAGSNTFGKLVPSLPGTYGKEGAPDDWQVCEWINLCRAVEDAGKFDVMHSHGYLLGLPLQRLTATPLVNTIHVCPSENEASLWHLFPESCVTAISRFQWSAFPSCVPAAMIHHGVDPAEFPFQAGPEDYLCFVGRFTSGKNPLAAIDVARKLGMKIVLAGPYSAFFEHHVKPLVDGLSVEYVGQVEGDERARLMGGARALLYPISTPEPFAS